jgi:hypothetical protein
VPFGPLRQITYQRLLENLRTRCGCSVTLEDPGGIPDTDDSESGELYLVLRDPADPATKFAYIEVYHQNLIVLPAALASYCAQLDLSEDDVCDGPPN